MQPPHSQSVFSMKNNKIRSSGARRSTLNQIKIRVRQIAMLDVPLYAVEQDNQTVHSVSIFNKAGIHAANHREKRYEWRH